jgi:hypothetical protein
MSSDAHAPAGRARIWLLIALGAAAVALVASMMWPHTAATGLPSSSNPPRATQPRAQAQTAIDPNELKVRLEALEASRPMPGEEERNPFRFKPKPPPPPPPSEARPAPGGPELPSGPPPPPAPLPINLKFMGIVVRQDGRQVAQLSDCRGGTFQVLEGGIVDGRYRLVKIGFESIVIEYLDGKGRQTIRLEGCPPRT